jgi:hypothetical protein
LIGKDDDQSQAVGKLAPFLTPPLQEQALVLARSIEKSESRILALVRLAPHLAATQRDQVLNEAMDVATTVKWHRGNMRIFVETMGQLPSSHQQKALERAVTNKLTGVVVALLPGLPDPLQCDALVALQAITDPSERVLALSRVAAHLPDQLRLETLAAIESLEEDSGRDRALINLAPWVPQSALQKAVNIAEGLDDPHDWAEAMAILLSRWAEAGHAEEALEVLDQMDWSQANLVGHQRSLRAQTLAAILPSLTTAKARAVAVRDAAENLKKLESKYMFTCAVANVARFLPEPERTGLIAEAFQATLDNQRWEERAEALKMLAPHLPVSLLVDAASAAAQLPGSPYLNRSPRADTLSALAERLATLDPARLYSIWSSMLTLLSRSARPDLLWDLPALCGVMNALGCANAPLVIAHAITEVARRWP